MKIARYIIITVSCMDKKNTFYALVTAESVQMVKATDLNYPSVVGTLLNALKMC